MHAIPECLRGVFTTRRYTNPPLSYCSGSVSLVVASDSMVQPQMDGDWFRNISNLDLVEPKRIRDSICLN